MKVEITNAGTGDFVKLIPENPTDVKQLLMLGPSYKTIRMGGYLDGSIGLSCEKG